MKRLNSEETKKLLELSIILKEKRYTQFKVAFQTILVGMIERVDDGYNILVGNEAMASEYAEILIKEIIR